DAHNMPLRKFLERITAHQNIAYQLEDKTISLSPKRETVVSAEPAPEEMQQTIATGVVLDADTQEPLVGVTVQVKGTAIQSKTDAKGRFQIRLPADDSTP